MAVLKRRKGVKELVASMWLRRVREELRRREWKVAWVVENAVEMWTLFEVLTEEERKGALPKNIRVCENSLPMMSSSNDIVVLFAGGNHRLPDDRELMEYRAVIVVGPPNLMVLLERRNLLPPDIFRARKLVLTCDEDDIREVLTACGVPEDVALLAAYMMRDRLTYTDLYALVRRVKHLTGRSNDESAVLRGVLDVLHELVEETLINSGAQGTLKLVRWYMVRPRRFWGFRKIAGRLLEHIVRSLTDYLWDRSTVEPPNGVFFFGPPGNGKSTLMMNLAIEIARRCPRLLVFELDILMARSKLFGETEAKTQMAFDLIDRFKPCIVLMDEVESQLLVRRREQLHECVIAQINCFLRWRSNSKDVFIMMTSNEPELVDRAAIRSKRVDCAVLVPYPDFATRRDIVAKEAERLGLVFKQPSATLDEAVRLSTGMSCSDIVRCLENVACAIKDKRSRPVDDLLLEEFRRCALSGLDLLARANELRQLLQVLPRAELKDYVRDVMAELEAEAKRRIGGRSSPKGNPWSGSGPTGRRIGGHSDQHYVV
ncbi:MAG: hypothetical protein DRN06_05920 [Thermoprotei archaeon]|nr:MAG: hypothetical protein DRN06_05920 [Thermoprotei archaeon]